MFKRTGKHAAKRLHIGPLFALFAAGSQLFAAMEGSAAIKAQSAAQLTEITQSGR